MVGPEIDLDAASDTSSATFRVMDVEDVSLDLPSPYPAVTLVESEPPMRALVFPVGLPEGTALAQALRRMSSRRPMTHELFMQVLQQARIDVIALRLVGRDEGNLLAELDLMTPEGRVRVDCRPSDGIVLACACRCRLRSWSTSASSTRWAMSSPSPTTPRRPTPRRPTAPTRRSAASQCRPGSDLIGA